MAAVTRGVTLSRLQTPGGLRRALRHLGLSHAEAARQMGLSANALSLMATGARPIERRTALVLRCWLDHGGPASGPASGPAPERKDE